MTWILGGMVGAGAKGKRCTRDSNCQTRIPVLAPRRRPEGRYDTLCAAGAAAARVPGEGSGVVWHTKVGTALRAVRRRLGEASLPTITRIKLTQHRQSRMVSVSSQPLNRRVGDHVGAGGGGDAH